MLPIVRNQIIRIFLTTILIVKNQIIRISLTTISIVKKPFDKTKIKKNSSSGKLSTFTHGNVNLNPHFLILRVNNVYKPDFDLTKNKTNISSISFYVTEPSVALYKNGKIYARSTGISILYCKDTKKNHTACMIVRVI